MCTIQARCSGKPRQIARREADETSPIPIFFTSLDCLCPSRTDLIASITFAMLPACVCERRVLKYTETKNMCQLSDQHFLLIIGPPPNSIAHQQPITSENFSFYSPTPDPALRFAKKLRAPQQFTHNTFNTGDRRQGDRPMTVPVGDCAETARPPGRPPSAAEPSFGGRD